MSARTRPDQPQEPSLTELLAIFHRKHAPVLLHQAAYLQAAEQGVSERREAGDDEKTLPPPGMYESQAAKLRVIIATLAKAQQGQPLATSTPLERMELQEQFTAALGTMRMVLGEHAAVNKETARRASPKRLEAIYRRKHYIPADDELEPRIAKRIKRVAGERKEQLGIMTEETVKIAEASEALRQIREAIFPSPPRRSGGEEEHAR
ncbi:MAG: hypothetical protein K2Q01_12015 [Rickettsiales bacterium]|nr:hypothetical protein [Rickettsiales bacterium]